MSKCLKAQVPKSFNRQMPECPSGRKPQVFEFQSVLSAQVPFECSLLPHLINNEKILFDKNKLFEKCGIFPVNLEKTLEYLKIQETLRSEDFTECCVYIKNILICLCLP